MMTLRSLIDLLENQNGGKLQKKYIIIQNKWHRGRRWKFKFTLAARPLLIIP
jgi:hypothetical protein